MGEFFPPHEELSKKGEKMKKIISVLMLGVIVFAVAGCACNCKSEPIVQENQKLIVPPNFGNMPK